MNKKDINALKKEFNLDTYKLKIKEIYSVYLKKDNKAVIHSEIKYFDALDTELQELYLGNFKKLLSGTIDTKLFELPFIGSEEGNPTQNVLINALESDEIGDVQSKLDLMVNRVAEVYPYEQDIVISFIRAEYLRASSKKTEDYEIGEDDNSDKFQFIMTSINKVEIPKKTLMFDSQNQELRTSSSLDVTINVKSPIEGFMFPVLDNGYTDVNKVIYYTSSNKEKNLSFVEEVLSCNISLTAEEEKDYFNSILTTVTGGKMTPSLIQEIYEEMQERVIDLDEEETPTINANDIKNILVNKNIEIVQDVDEAYEEVLATKEHEFKIDNILPKANSKSIKIMNQDTNITIAPSSLNSIKQIRDKNGNKCLLIQLTEDIVVDGIRIEVEEEI